MKVNDNYMSEISQSQTKHRETACFKEDSQKIDSND